MKSPTFIVRSRSPVPCLRLNYNKSRILFLSIFVQKQDIANIFPVTNGYTITKV